MYHRRVEFSVSPGKLDEFEAWSDKFAEDRKKAAGFLSQSLLRSYSTPSRYTTMIRWENEDAADAYSRSAQFKSFLANNSVDGWQLARPNEAYESVFDVNAEPMPDPATASCEVFADINLTRGPSSIPELEARVRAMGEAFVKNAPGFGSLRLRRSLGKPYHYLMIGIATDREAAASAMTDPKVRSALGSGKGLAEIVGRPLDLDTYRVVKRI